MSDWHKLDPERFPALPDWSYRPIWMTDKERQVAADLERLHAEREKVLQVFGVQEAELEAAYAAAREEADSFERRLLTAQHEELADAVLKVLTELGFEVENADEQAAKRDYLEDLQIRDPQQPGLVALGEVKGHTKGAQTAVFANFSRVNKRYVAKHGVSPDRNWYIVNHFIGLDPSARQTVFKGQDGDLKALELSDGLVIDTALLFRILMAVRSGLVDPGTVRTEMWTQRGRFEPWTDLPLP